MGKLLNAVSKVDRLYRAWQDVRSQVRRTSWPHLVAELEQFDAAPIRGLRRIQRQLKAGTYRFSPKLAYTKRKSGGSRRGITVPTLNDRIVQRALLDVIYSGDQSLQRCLGDLPRTLTTATSFAGTPGRGVPAAVALVWQTIRKGAAAFAYSDMKDFFPCVPRQAVVEFVKCNIDDAGFVDLFAAALTTELENAAEVEPWLSLFPLGDVGVAQGALLSSLIGNLALREFDARLNRSPWTTIRYLDDFVVLAPDRDSVAEGFAAANAELANLGMECYQPDDGSQKAAIGLVRRGFDFLGCRIHPDGVAPSRKARRKLLRDIALTIATGKRQIASLRSGENRRRTDVAYAQVLVHIDRKLRGWGDAYRFVTNRVALTQIDAEVDRLLDRFHRWFHGACRDTPPRARRRMHGIALLADTPSAGPLRAPPDEEKTQ